MSSTVKVAYSFFPFIL